MADVHNDLVFVPTEQEKGPAYLSQQAMQRAFRQRWGVPPFVKFLMRVLELLVPRKTNVCVCSIRQIANAMNATNDAQVSTLLLLAQDLRLVAIGPIDPVSQKCAITICRGTYLQMASKES